MSDKSDHEEPAIESLSQEFGKLATALESIPGDSKKEADEWSLEEGNAWRQNEREQEAKDIVSRSLQGVVRVISNIAVLAVAAVAWHYLLPSWLSWLSGEQINGLLKFLLSGAVVGSVSNYFRQHA